MRYFAEDCRRSPCLGTSRHIGLPECAWNSKLKRNQRLRQQNSILERVGSAQGTTPGWIKTDHGVKPDLFPQCFISICMATHDVHLAGINKTQNSWQCYTSDDQSTGGSDSAISSRNPAASWSCLGRPPPPARELSSARRLLHPHLS